MRKKNLKNISQEGVWNFNNWVQMWQDSWQHKEKGRNNILTLYVWCFTKYRWRFHLYSNQVLLPWGVDFTGLREEQRKLCLSLEPFSNFAVCKGAQRNLLKCRLLDCVFGDSSHRSGTAGVCAVPVLPGSSPPGPQTTLWPILPCAACWSWGQSRVMCRKEQEICFWALKLIRIVFNL